MKRRDKKCQLCGEEHHLAAHHIEDGSNHPEGRTDIKNGITLCSECHEAFHCSFKSSYREKCTMKDWLNFLELVALFRGKYLTPYVREMMNTELNLEPYKVNT